MALRDEIDLAQAKLAERGCPDSLYKAFFLRFRGIASSTLLPAEWHTHKPGLSPDVKLAFEWSAWLLPDEEEELEPNEWQALVSELDELEALQHTASPHARIRASADQPAPFGLSKEWHLGNQAGRKSVGAGRWCDKQRARDCHRGT